MRRRTSPIGEGGRRRGRWIEERGAIPPPIPIVAAAGAVVALLLGGVRVSAQQPDNAPIPPTPAAAANAAKPLESWVGKRVLTRYGTVLQVDGAPVKDERWAMNQARGKDQTRFLVYKVERVNDPWLWIEAEHSGEAGWVQAADLIELDQAADYFTTLIRANPSDAWRFIWRGNVWNAMGEMDKALRDYGEAIRLAPDDAVAYNNRGAVHRARGDLDHALADYEEAVRLDPDYATARINRGEVLLANKEYNRAIADFDAAVNLVPTALKPRSRKVRARLFAGQPEVIADAWTAISADGWKTAYSLYDAIAGHFGARRVGDAEAAKAFLDEAASKGNKDLWPYPVIRYLRDEIDEKALLELADEKTDVDGMARCYIAFDELLDKRIPEARANFLWVKNHAPPNFIEYIMATAELERLDAAEVGEEK